jgi:trans-aconitate methyltransferase
MGANLGAKVIGLDSSPNLLKIAKKRVPDGDFRLGTMNSSFPWQDESQRHLSYSSFQMRVTSSRTSADAYWHDLNNRS